MNVDGKTFVCQFGVYTFVYHHGAEVPVQAQKNKWASPWTENWFYLRLAGEPSLCSELSKLDSVTSEGVMTDACAAAVDALRALSLQQCACDLVEEYVCARVIYTFEG